MTQTTTQQIKDAEKNPHLSNSTFLMYAQQMAELLERAALIFETVDKGKYWLEDFKKFQEEK